MAARALPSHRILRSEPAKTWRELIDAHAAPGQSPQFTPLPSSRPFFDSFLFNAVFQCLAHPWMPDVLAVWLLQQVRIRMEKPSVETFVPGRRFIPTGPTRYYMSQNLGRAL